VVKQKLFEQKQKGKKMKEKKKKKEKEKAQRTQITRWFTSILQIVISSSVLISATCIS